VLASCCRRCKLALGSVVVTSLFAVAVLSDCQNCGVAEQAQPLSTAVVLLSWKMTLSVVAASLVAVSDFAEKLSVGAWTASRFAVQWFVALVAVQAAAAVDVVEEAAVAGVQMSKLLLPQAAAF